MELKIYDKNNNLRLTASPNSSSTVTEEIGGECSVSASFTHTAYVPLDVDDYIELEGVRYKVKSRYRPKQKNTQTYEYSVKFYAPIHDAEDTLMLFQEGGTTSEFSYDGGPREHLQLWIDNMNRRAGGNLWSIGTVITSENKTIDYRNVKCWDAAFGSNGIAATFETEMWADGYVINLCKAERGEVVELGYLQGLTNLAQEDNGEVKFFTRLFPLGSTRNIDATKYGYSRLQLPDRSLYVDKNVDLYGVKEETEEDAFSEIYPKYVGTVSSVRTEEKTSEEGRKYTVYYFKDNGMNWNPKDYEIPNLDYMLQFQTGELAGRGTDGSFQAAWHEDTREWEIINVYPDDTTQIPGDVIIPNPGDKYIPWNFAMPQEYITAAEQAYKQAVDDFLNTYSFDPNKYTGTTDRNYIEKNNTPLRIGWNVRLLSEQYFGSTGGYKDTRITKVQRKLNDLCQATITCSDEVGTGWKSSVDNSLDSLRYEVARQAEQTIIDILTSTDRNTPSDNNVYSALASLLKFHRKDKTDENPYLQKFLKGIELGKFVSGLLGTGGAIQIDQDGNSHAEFDYLTIRKLATFIELIIQEAKHVGGMLIVSPSGMTISKVEETDTAYRCYFEQTDGDRTLQNQFTVGTQARRQTFNLTEQAYYWRLVTAVGDDYVDLSKTDCDTGSTIPQAGDELVGLGHRTDKTRQAAIIISAFGTDSPSIKYYQGIDSYSLEDKAVKMDYYDPVSGRYKSVTYGDTYVGDKEGKNYIKFDQEEGVEVSGKVKIQQGSEGAGNFTDLPDEIYNAVKIGGENLLLNTGFLGDFESLKLDSNTNLKEGTEMYNTTLDKWNGTATLNQDENAVSGVSATIGRLSQGLMFIPNENYVISYKAKGTSLQIVVGGSTISQQLTNDYKKYSHVFTNSNSTSVTFSGAATICDIKLERGTIPTDWCPSVLDPDAVKDEFKNLWYLQDAMKGSTDVNGGLVLTSVVEVGKWTDGVMEKVNAGISGIYNDDTDVAFWAGGTFEQAIATVQKLIGGETPTDEEWKSMAKFVATHGGDVFIRGYIYALGGYFRGMVDLGNGVTRLNADGTGWIGKKEGNNPFIDFTGDKLKVNGVLEAGEGSQIGGLRVNANGALLGYSMTVLGSMSGFNLIPNNEDFIRNFIINNIGRAQIYELIFNTFNTGRFEVLLPNFQQISEKIPGIDAGANGFYIDVIVPAYSSFIGVSVQNNSEFAIHLSDGAKLFDQNGNEITEIVLSKGDVLGMVCILRSVINPGTLTQSEVHYFIKTLRQ
nr:MAG TPA: tail protein [Caudoviricetes sp.]